MIYNSYWFQLFSNLSDIIWDFVNLEDFLKLEIIHLEFAKKDLILKFNEIYQKMSEKTDLFNDRFTTLNQNNKK